MRSQPALPRILVTACLAVVSCATVFAQAGGQASNQPKIQPLNIKPGQWETTVNYKRSGQPPIPAGMLAKLSPEQRARLEQRMQANSSANTWTETSKGCVTKDDLEKMPNLGQGKGDCTYTIESSTSAGGKGSYKCNVEGMRATGDINIEAKSQELVKGITHGVMSGGGREMQLDTTFTSKWVGSHCESEN